MQESSLTIVDLPLFGKQPPVLQHVTLTVWWYNLVVSSSQLDSAVASHWGNKAAFWLCLDAGCPFVIQQVAS